MEEMRYFATHISGGSGVDKGVEGLWQGPQSKHSLKGRPIRGQRKEEPGFDFVDQAFACVSHREDCLDIVRLI